MSQVLVAGNNCSVQFKFHCPISAHWNCAGEKRKRKILPHRVPGSVPRNDGSAAGQLRWLLTGQPSGPRRPPPRWNFLSNLTLTLFLVRGEGPQVDSSHVSEFPILCGTSDRKGFLCRRHSSSSGSHERSNQRISTCLSTPDPLSNLRQLPAEFPGNTPITKSLSLEMK